MAREIIVAPDGQIEIGTMADDAGESFVAWRIPAAIDGADLILTFRLPHFVATADHLQMVASELLKRG